MVPTGEHVAYFSRHLGGRFESAGLRVQFHYNQQPGIQFKVSPSEEYRAFILKGLSEGLSLRFPDFPPSASVWIIEVMEHEIDSSPRGFYLAARLVIEQAFALASLSRAQQSAQADRPEKAGPTA